MGERIPTDELRRLVDLTSPGPWQAEPMTGRGAWIAAADGNWAALSCGETDQLGERNARLIALAPTLAAEVLQLREALQPFAAVAERDIGDDEADGDVFRPMQFLNHAPKLTVVDLRCARAALPPAPAVDAVKQGDA